MEKKVYDVIIIGAGPGGLTAGIYALRSGMKVLIIEKYMVGGQASLTYDIRNFPSYLTVSGIDLCMQMHEQVNSLGGETVYETVNDVELDGKIKKVITNEREYSAISIIIATGAKRKHIGLKNELNLVGSGVGYCALCEGAFYKEQDVVVVGGGNTAVEDVIYLSKLAKNVTIIAKPKITAEKFLVEELKKAVDENKNITIMENSEVQEIVGEKKVEGVKVKNLDGGEIVDIAVKGVFVSIGRMPDKDFIKDKIMLDDKGYIATNEEMQTSIEGVFACGDVRTKNVRQIVTACSDGAIAATYANKYYRKYKCIHEKEDC